MKIYVLLKGGLGNQMFQYAAARALAKRKNAELVLDAWSGFANDMAYKRSFELAPFAIKARLAKWFERSPIWLFRIKSRIFSTPNQFYEKKYFGRFVSETKFSYISDMVFNDINKSIWMIGYWQSPRYFEDYKDLLLNELMPPSPKKNTFLNIGNKILNSESVALGIRLYEESCDPAAHSFNRIVKTVDDVNRAIQKMLSEKPTSKFFVFCTHRSPFLSGLKLPENTVYLIQDDGYERAIDCLWLLSRCKHHIFMNSSYYWWGAWLSQKLHSGDKQMIYAADNFINSDGICEEWKKF